MPKNACHIHPTFRENYVYALGFEVYNPQTKQCWKRVCDSTGVRWIGINCGGGLPKKKLPMVKDRIKKLEF